MTVTQKGTWRPVCGVEGAVGLEVPGQKLLTLVNTSTLLWFRFLCLLELC